MNDHELAAELAAAAGRQLLELRAQYSVPDEAAARALAKLADQLANDWLLQQLAELRPDDAVLSEEAEDDLARVQAQRVWIIDPVDGTYEFARRLADFAVHVALWDNSAGSFTAAAVAVPDHGAVWATDSAAAAIESDRTQLTVVSSTREPKPVLAKLQVELSNIAAALGYAGVEFRTLGSVGGKVHQLLAGHADVYLSTTGFWEWDAAAPAAVAQQQGFQVTDLQGAALRFNQVPPRVSSFVVAKPQLHEFVINALAEVNG